MGDATTLSGGSTTYRPALTINPRGAERIERNRLPTAVGFQEAVSVLS